MGLRVCVCVFLKVEPHLPGQAVSPVAVHFPPTGGRDPQTRPPPHLVALLDDAAPQPAGARGAAQTPGVQLAEDPRAHFRRQRLGEVFGGGAVGHQGGSSLGDDEHGRSPGRGAALHDGAREADSRRRPAETERFTGYILTLQASSL